MNKSMEDIIKVLSVTLLTFIIKLTNAFRVFTNVEELQISLTDISIVLAIIFTVYKLVTDIIDRINKKK